MRVQTGICPWGRFSSYFQGSHAKTAESIGNKFCMGHHMTPGSLWIIEQWGSGSCAFQIQGILVPKLTLGPFLSLTVRNGPNLQSYLFQEYIYFAIYES